MKILIVDEHALFRQGVAILLRDLYPGAAILEAAGAPEALVAARLNKDIRLVLGDLRADATPDFQALKRLVKALPGAAVAILSESDAAGDIARAYRAGARGYILKSSSSATLRHALPLMLAGEIYIPSSAVTMLTDAAVARPARPAGAGARPSLTPRQHEILLLMARGLQNRDIAAELGMLEGTVKVHVKSILSRLGVNNRTQAVVAGLRRGLVPASLVLPEPEVSD
ncbi:MAG: response regulator transcription factor [Rhodospirillales bacterium]|nr:MAG: response regulator transcription factor [Rhodospirillales bacterium]